MKPTRRLSRSTKSSKSLHPPEDHTSGVRRAAKSTEAEPAAIDAPALPPNMRPTVKLGRVKQPVETKPSERPTLPPPEDEAAAASPVKPSVPPSRPSASSLTRASFGAVPYVAIAAAQVRKRTLDPPHAFVLGLLDGHTSIESLLDACPLTETAVLVILNDLLKDGIIALR